MKEGRCFGENALKENAKRETTVFAYSDSVELLEVTRESILEILKGENINELIYDTARSLALSYSITFKLMNSFELGRITKKFETKYFKKGEIILQSGSKIKHFYICVEGQMAYGDEKIGERVYEKGVIFDDYFICPLSNANIPLKYDLYAKSASFVSSVSFDDVRRILNDKFDNIQTTEEIENINNFENKDLKYKRSNTRRATWMPSLLEITKEGGHGLLGSQVLYGRIKKKEVYLELKVVSLSVSNRLNPEEFLKVIIWAIIRKNEIDMYKRDTFEGQIPTFRGLMNTSSTQTMIYSFIEGQSFYDAIKDRTKYYLI